SGQRRGPARRHRQREHRRHGKRRPSRAHDPAGRRDSGAGTSDQSGARTGAWSSIARRAAPGSGVWHVSGPRLRRRRLMNATTLVVDIAGWLGAGSLLLAYALLSMGRLRPRVGYQLLNLAGGLGLAVNTAYHQAW